MTAIPTFDEILNSLLNSHFNRRGQDAGVLLQVFYSAVAVCVWGLYRFAHLHVYKQAFADTSDRPNLEKHLKTRGLNWDSDETDDELLTKWTDDVQYPRTGWTAKDIARYAKEVTYTHDEGGAGEWTETVEMVKVHENQRGGGSVNVAITSNRAELGFEEVPTTELVSEVLDYLETKRPLGIWDVVVYSTTQLIPTIVLQIQADNYSSTAVEIRSQLMSFIVTLLPGESLSIAKIIGIATDAGAADVNVASPPSNIEPDNGPTSYERIWPVTGNIIIGAM